MRLLFVLLSFLLSPALLHGQRMYYRHLTAADGLPSNKVYSATRDKQGFMWFSTDNGLCRYSGSKFDFYTVKSGLPDNDIFKVFEDHEGRIWILSFKQTPCFYENGILRSAANDSFLSTYFQQPEMYQFDVNNVKKRILFFVVRNNQYEMLEYGKKPVPIPVSNPYASSKGSTLQLFQSDLGDIVLNSNYAFVIQNGLCTKIPLDRAITEVDQFAKNGISYALTNEVRRGHCTVYSFSSDTLNKEKELESLGLIGPYTGTNNDVVFASASGNILRFNKAKLAFEKTNFKIPYGRISNIHLDKDGNIWVCTLNNGVFLFPPENLVLLETAEDIAPAAIVQDPKTRDIYVGFENKTIHKYSGDVHKKRIQLPFKSYINQRITSMVLKHGNLYIGGDFDLCYLNIHSGKYYGALLELLLQSIKDIEPASGNNIIIGSANGAGLWDCSTNKLVQVFWKTRTTAVYEDNKGNCYFGTVNGLYVQKKNGSQVEQFKTKTNLDIGRITDIKSDLEGNLWIGTAQYGLFEIMPNMHVNHFDHEGTPNAITSYYIKHIFIDEFNQIWVSTDKGVNRIGYRKNAAQFKIDLFTNLNGSSDQNINSTLVIHDTVYAISLSGISRFVNASGYFREKPGLEITGIWVNNKSQVPSKTYNLPYWENNISLEFTAIAFKSQDNIVYRYRLENSDTTWALVRNRRIDLLSLKPGTYAIDLQAVNAITGEFSEIRKVAFVIEQAWFKKPWFLLLVAISILLIAFWVLRNRYLQIKKQSHLMAETAKKMANLEMQAIRAQMNPHFIFNALTAIQNYFVTHREEEANAYMARFSRLIRQMLESSHNNFIRLDEEIDLISNYMELEKIRFETAFQFMVTIAPEIHLPSHRVPSMLLQPLLENAINHGIRPLKTPGTVRLNISATQDHLVFEVSDDGVGFSNPNGSEDPLHPPGHKSRGLELLQNRIESINMLFDCKISYERVAFNEQSIIQKGTKIILQFPLELTQIPMTIL